jgi:hypothetical protein
MNMNPEPQHHAAQVSTAPASPPLFNMYTVYTEDIKTKNIFWHLFANITTFKKQ